MRFPPCKWSPNLKQALFFFLSSQMGISDATAINFHSSGSVPCLLLAITVGSRMILKTGGTDSCLVVLFTFSHTQLWAGMRMHILINCGPPQTAWGQVFIDIGFWLDNWQADFYCLETKALQKASKLNQCSINSFLKSHRNIALFVQKCSRVLTAALLARWAENRLLRCPSGQEQCFLPCNIYQTLQKAAISPPLSASLPLRWRTISLLSCGGAANMKEANLLLPGKEE